MSNPLLTPSTMNAGRIMIRVMGAALILLILATAWIGFRGYIALGHLQNAQASATVVANDPTDTDSATRAVRNLQTDVAAAHRLTSDPIWLLSQKVPFLGPQLAAVSEVADALNTMAGQGLTPLVSIAGDFSPANLTPVDGRIDTSPLAEISEAAETSARHMRTALSTIEAIDQRGLLPPLATAVNELSEQVQTATSAVDGIHRASVLAPKFLGEDGKRTYLVLGQNNAEWRSLGGMIGAMFVAHTDNGGISFGNYKAETDFDNLSSPAVELSQEVQDLFTPNPAKHPQNATQISHFPESAHIAQTVWRRRMGDTVDGVIAIDPVTLSYLLDATGPITVPAGFGHNVQVSSKNAVPLLLNEVYLDYSVAEQDALFQATTAGVLSKIMAGDVDAPALLSALTQAARERRILLWSDREEEQAVLDGTALQGALPTSNRTHTRFGVYFNDGTGSKLSYYMASEVGATWCSVASDSAEAELRVVLHNNAPQDVTSLPESVVGPGYYNTKRGLTRNIAYLYLPQNSTVVRSDMDGDGPLGGFGRGTHQGYDVLVWETVLKPGESASATVTVRTKWTPNLELVSTPTIPGNSSIIEPSCN